MQTEKHDIEAGVVIVDERESLRRAFIEAKAQWMQAEAVKDAAWWRFDLIYHPKPLFTQQEVDKLVNDRIQTARADGLVVGFCGSLVCFALIHGVYWLTMAAGFRVCVVN